MSMHANGRPAFRADHVGSLLRPPVLRQSFRRHAAGEIGDEEFARVQDACIREVVRLQEDTGLKVVTDGEFRRGSYWGRFVERTDGFEIRKAQFKFRDDQGHEAEFTAPYAKAKIRRIRPLTLDEFAFLRDVTQGIPKITMPAPSTMHFYRCTDFAERAVYDGVDSFMTDLAFVFEQEIRDLVASGCRYIQFDEVAVALLCDPDITSEVRSAGAEPYKLIDLYIEGINRAVASCTADVVTAVHMCRGNFKGHYLGKGGYESVAERFFARTNVRQFLLEYDTPRAGDFQPLRFVPKNKSVVLGLISTKTPALETIDMLKRRVDEATRFVDFDRLALCPQCGFASTVAGNPLSEADERAKLRLLVEATQAIWGQA